MEKPRNIQKRPTRPKIRGCHECSQRRIDCDRSEPECSKCRTKGLQCSGLGVRVRFEPGIASRGKFVSKTMHDLSLTRCTRQNGGCGRNKPTPRAVDTSSSEEETCGRARRAPAAQANNKQTTHQPVEAIPPVRRPSLSLPLDQLDTVPGWKRAFLSHFSNKIAPCMVAIDDSSNGWRKLILLIAIHDEVVMNAVIAASAYHISATSQTALSLGLTSLTRAINGLLRRQNLQRHDVLINGFSVVAIFVLLVASMVTGCSDFPFIFGMLKSAVAVMRADGGSGNKELDEFLLLQYNKYLVYGEPLVSEKDGIEAVRTRAGTSFDCLRHCAIRNPRHTKELAKIRSQIEIAYEVYLRRASDDLEPMPAFELLERARHMAEESASSDTPEHVLIWPTFIVAAESSTPEHRSFLAGRLKYFHVLTGFENTLKALALLKAIWREKDTGGTKWTALLPQMQTFIV